MADNAERFSWLVRLGYAARGLVYILLGYLALSTAGRAAGGAAASFDVVQDIPLGFLVLYLTAAGLLAYAAFKFISALSDIQNHGGDAKGMAKRIGDGASAVTHTLLAWTAFQFARDTRQSAGSDSGGQEAASTVLTWEMGAVVVGLVGAGFLIGAAMQARSAATAGFMKRVGAGAPAAVEWIGRVGHAARAVVFAVIGWSLVRSAWFDRSGEVKGIGKALASLRDNEVLYMLVAAGLLLFGVFSLIVARYRIIPRVHREDLKPSLQ